MPSFDVVSKVNLQEVDNAVNNAKKEIASRFDFQGTKTEITFADDKTAILLKSESEGRVQAAYDVLTSKMIKRNVSLRCLEPGEMDKGALGSVKQTVKLIQGISQEKAKEVVKMLKESKLRVQASIQGEQLRVSGKNKDDLQEAIALLRQKQDALKLDLQFTNFRD